jgi:hypothetical protein
MHLWTMDVRGFDDFEDITFKDIGCNRLLVDRVEQTFGFGNRCNQ